MTTANKITILRILLIPFFVVEVLYYGLGGNETHRLLAVVCFALAAIFDGVDGYIARRYNQRSELGAILDPLADKLLLVSGVVLLSLHNEPFLPRIPLWLTATILSRDVLLLIGLVVIHYSCGKVSVRPILVGKVATVLQMACVLWGLFKWDTHWLWGISFAAAICTGASGIYYVFEGVRQLSASPASSPSPRQ
jgi:CDP-diacylglycerol--glycerol-3-phosphate 3-phosphatidyltransferase